MFFPDLLTNDKQREEHRKVCADFSAFLKDGLCCLIEACRIADQAAAKSSEIYHSTIILLTRHVIEYVDGVAPLISQGGSQPCLPLLRSALEATMGVMYILQADTKRRALAYQVAHIHRMLKLYEEVDPTTDEGKKLRAYLGAEADELFRNVPIEFYPKMLTQVRTLNGLLTSGDYAPIEQEWQTKKKEPAWYSLFGGPQNARELASKVGWALMYSFAFRNWSDEVHAGAAMAAAGLKDGVQVMRPIRHPEQLQSSLIHAMNFTLQLALSLVQTYAPDKLAEIKKNYVDTIHQRRMELLGKKLITAAWQDSSF